MTVRKLSPGIPGKRGYMVKNPVLLTALKLIDYLPWPIKQDVITASPPRRLLLSSFGHLGDCVIATATLDLVRTLLPETEIGVIVGSWAAEVFLGDPRVSWLHLVDHWRLDRTEAPFAKKLGRYLRTRRSAIDHIRSLEYDAAIDLFYFFPPAGPIFRAAGIPKRIGYASGGFRRHLTHPHPWVLADQHVAFYQASLLADLSVPHDRLQRALTDLRMAPAISGAGSRCGDYVIVHMGANGPEREWPEDRWRVVVSELAGRGIPVMLTGRGAIEAARCTRIARGLPGVINRCDALDWTGFLETIASARLLIGVNSLSGHLAAACGVPTITLWAGVVNPAQWRPLGPKATILHSAPPCLPCYEWRGCAGMQCIRDVEPKAVLSAAIEALALA